MAQAAKQSYPDRGRNSVPRTLAFDRQTDELLMRLSGGKMSSFVKALIWKELGRREVMAALAGASAEDAHV